MSLQISTSVESHIMYAEMVHVKISPVDYV